MWLALALVAVAAAPVPVMLWTPLLLGVPHVVADVRWLVVQPAWGGQARPWLWATILSLGACRAAALMGHGPPVGVELGLGLAAALGALWSGGGRAAALVGWGLCAAAAWSAPAGFALAVGHLHNGVALLLWALLGDRSARWVVAGAAAATAAIFAGALDGASWSPVGGLSLDGLAATLAPGLAAPWSTRVVTSFALLQLLHYAAWLVWIPRAAGERGSWREALGTPAVVAVAVASVGLPAAAALGSPAAVRAGYLSLVLFHGWIELVTLAHLAGGRRGAG
jgi:hypothetical protein